MRPSAVATLCVLAALAPAAGAQTSAPQATLDQFYPTDRLKPLTAAERQSCSAPLAAPGPGASQPDAILAGYTDRSGGALRLLRRGTAGGFEVAFDSPDAWMMPGSRCVIRLRDVDFDGRPEALVFFQGVRASAGWIFAWDGTALRNLTPVETVAGRVSSLLLDPQLYDLDLEGPLEIVASRRIERPAAGARSRNPAFVYRLTEDGYRPQGSLLAIAAYRADVDPRGNLRAFRLLEDSTGPYRVRLVNGDRSGRRRVTGATVEVNDVRVIEPRDLTGAMAFVSAAIPSLAVQNHLTATLDGPPDATLLVLIEDGTER